MDKEQASRQKQPVLLRPALPHVRHVNSRPPEHRTFSLADAASDAEFEVHVRLLDDHGLSLPVPYPRLFEPDGLFRGGADLLAHDARPSVSPGQAPALVDHGEPDLYLRLFFYRKLFDCSRGADLTAERASVLAVAYARHEHRRPDAFDAGLEQRRLEPIRGADLHAIPALDTALQKFLFLERPGRPEERRFLRPCFRERRRSEQRHRNN